MAHLYRLIVAACLAAFSLSVHALVPQVPQWYLQWNWETTAQRHYGPSASAACDAATAAGNARIVSTGNQLGGVTFTAPKTCTAKTSTGINIGNADAALSGASVCPANSTLSGGSCVCTSPYVENSAHTACEMPPNECQQKAGQPDGIWRYDGGYGATANPLSSEICKKGTGVRCVVKVADPQCQQVKLQGSGNPFWLCRGNAFYTGGYGTGAACDRSASANGDGGTGVTLPPITVDPPPDQLPPNTAAPTDCPAGTFEGTVNGTHTCVENLDAPTSTNSPQTGQTTTKNPDGSTTTTTTTGTTTCSAGSCTTTNNVSSNITNNPASTCPQGTTPSGPGGSASSCTGTSSNSTSQAQSEFCKANPGDKQCAGKEGGAFGGSCAAGFVATGEDPILNAMAKEQYLQNCKLNPDDASQVVGRTEAAKTGNQTGDNPNNASFSIGAGSFDMSNALGGGASCIADKQIMVMGKSVNIAFSMICEYLEALGLVMVGVSMLLAARIVTRG
jgi:hypothetical protein